MLVGLCEHVEAYVKLVAFGGYPGPFIAQGRTVT
jgi:hypothetical protein